MTTKKTTQAKKPTKTTPRKQTKKAADKKTAADIDAAVELEGLPANLKAAIAKKRGLSTAAASAPPAQELAAIDLKKIVASPLNPRKHFDGQDFDDLVDSVRQKDVISPILVRPIAGGLFEIVYGERRYRAKCRVTEESAALEPHTITALVRHLNEAEAFELMTIENLKRADLTELEEAASFKAYVERNGEESLLTLAERTGIKPAYIRRRIMVMSLPEHILQEWGNGPLKYGHLEQLARLGDNPERLEKVFGEVMGSAGGYQGIMSVDRLRHNIASASPDLRVALFDPAAEGCLTCFHNSDVQKNLFALDSSEIRCTKPECFMRKKSAWLEANWPEFSRRNKLTTNGFRFHEVVGYGAYHQIYKGQKISDSCKDCANFLSVLHLNTIEAESACFGEEKCHKREILGQGKGTSVGPDKDKSAGVVDTAPRVGWHGSFFRDLFFQERLPGKLEETADDDLRIQRLALFSFIKNVSHLHPWFAHHTMLRPLDKIDKWTSLGDEEIFRIVGKMSAPAVSATFKSAALASVLDDEHATSPRRIFADHLGIDVAAEWSITEEYLKKKVKSEILAFITAHSLCDDKTFANYLSTTHNCLTSEIDQLKKPALMDALLNSGVNLVGKVPAEILADKDGE